jgi:hypothetical protein
MPRRVRLLTVEVRVVLEAKVVVVDHLDEDVAVDADVEDEATVLPVV